MRLSSLERGGYWVYMLNRIIGNSVNWTTEDVDPAPCTCEGGYLCSSCTTPPVVRYKRRRLRAIFDLDSIIADLLNPWLAWYNRAWDDNLTLEQITDYDLGRHVKPECGESIYGFFQGEAGSARYASIPIIDGAQEGLAKLHKNGVEIIIATATAKTKNTASLKYDIIKRAAPWLPQGNVMIGKRKELLRGDFFIDDSPSMIEAYRQEWISADILTIGYPYNQSLRDKVDLFAEDCFNTKKAWNSIVDYILSAPA